MRGTIDSGHSFNAESLTNGMQLSDALVNSKLMFQPLKLAQINVSNFRVGQMIDA